jgi:hypothetical protein
MFAIKNACMIDSDVRDDDGERIGTGFPFGFTFILLLDHGIIIKQMRNQGTVCRYDFCM